MKFKNKKLKTTFLSFHKLAFRTFIFYIIKKMKFKNKKLKTTFLSFHKLAFRAIIFYIIKKMKTVTKGSADKAKVHLVKWSQVCCPKVNGA